MLLGNNNQPPKILQSPTTHTYSQSRTTALDLSKKQPLLLPSKCQQQLDSSAHSVKTIREDNREKYKPPSQDQSKDVHFNKKSRRQVVFAFIKPSEKIQQEKNYSNAHSTQRTPTSEANQKLLSREQSNESNIVRILNIFDKVKTFDDKTKAKAFNGKALKIEIEQINYMGDKTQSPSIQIQSNKPKWNRHVNYKIGSNNSIEKRKPTGKCFSTISGLNSKRYSIDGRQPNINILNLKFLESGDGHTMLNEDNTNQFDCNKLIRAVSNERRNTIPIRENRILPCKNASKGNYFSPTHFAVPEGKRTPIHITISREKGTRESGF
jgi:hypothetical protein